ncbi:MAG TPA: hypothetical protein VM490_16400 [Armatimonadaceae bacterium]|nr:hypothetical protein [Armatimonadaceae bacterium]
MSDTGAGRVWTTADGHLLWEGEPVPIYSHSPVRLPDGTLIDAARPYVEKTEAGTVVREYGAPFSSTLEELLYVSGIHVVLGDRLFRFGWEEKVGPTFRTRLSQAIVLRGLVPRDDFAPAPSSASEDDPRPHFEIVPGVGVGPFRLGMTRDEARAVAAADNATNADGDTLSLEPLALTLRFDGAGRCREIEARVFSARPDTEPRFTLLGREVNNIDEDAARALFPALDRPDSGLRSLKWESTDDFLFALVVRAS